MARRGGIRLPGPDDVERVGITRDPGLRVPDLSVDFGGVDFSGLEAKLKQAAEKQQRLLDATKTAEAYEAFGRTGMDEFNKRRLEDDPSRPDFMEDFGSYLDQGMETAVSGLPEQVSETAKAELRIRLMAQRNAFLDSAGQVHLGALQDSAAAAIDNQVNTWGAMAQRDPGSVEGILDLVDEGLAPFAGALPAAKETQYRTAARGAVIESAVNGLIDLGGLREARAMLADDRFSADLDPNRRAILGNRIDAEQKRREAEAKAAAREARAIALAEFQILANDEQAARARGTTTGQWSDDIAINALGPEKGQKFVASLNATQQLALDIREMSLMPQSEQEALVQSYKPEGENFAAEADRFDALSKARETLNHQFTTDPVTYLLTYNNSIRDAYKTMAEAQTAADRKAASERYVELMKAEQERLGGDPNRVKLLPDGYADAIAAQFSNQKEGGASAADLSAGLAEQWGKNWPQVYAELAPKLPSAAVVIGSGMSPGPAAALAEASKNSKALKDAIPSDVQKTVRDSVAAELGELAATLIPAPGGTNTLGTFTENTELLALQYVAGGDDPDTAARKAAIETVNRNYTYAGTYRVPIRYDSDLVHVGSQRAMGELLTTLKEQVDLPTSLVGLPEAETRQQYFEAIKSNGRWITAPDESGLVLYDETGNAVTVGGRPYVKTWDELLNMQRQFGTAGRQRLGLPEQ